MNFLYPNVLYALILPALLAAAAWWLWRRRSSQWEVLVSPEYRQEMVHAPATWHRVLPVIFAVLASIFAILSIARPVDGYTCLLYTSDNRPAGKPHGRLTFYRVRLHVSYIPAIPCP